MPSKPLTPEQLQNLLNPPKKAVASSERPQPQNVVVQFADSIRPDPTKRPIPGEMQPGDKGDIWAQWVKQKRTGAKELIERWG